MLEYAIIPVSIIEASTSPEPDDISRVNIRIECKATASGNLQRIDFIVKIAPNGSTDATIRKAALTTSPKSITPVAEDFRKWTFAFLSERSATEAIFRASPQVPGHFELGAGEKVTFILRDIEVIDQDGETQIGVEELELNQTAPSILAPALKLRKIYPNLRIDRFTATPSIVGSKQPVVLSWGTTGATKIVIVNEKLPGQPTDPDLRDSQITVNPETTTTYELKASAGESAEISRQVTVTVPDQVKARKLIVGELPSAFTLGEGDASVQGTLTAKTISGDGAVPAGVIVMWHGSIAAIPKGWGLCDGQEHRRADGTLVRTANLVDRFVVCASVDSPIPPQEGKYAVNQEGGSNRVTLNESQMPSHVHTVTVQEGGRHAHTLLRNSVAPALQFTGTSGENGLKSIKAGDDSNTGAAIGTNFAASHGHSATAGAAGGNTSFDNRPLFLALAYIEKL